MYNCMHSKTVVILTEQHGIIRPQYKFERIFNASTLITETALLLLYEVYAYSLMLTLRVLKFAHAELSHPQKECYNPDCLVDRSDCTQNVHTSHEIWRDCPDSECQELFNNGVCNPQCQSSQCNFDGMDCVRPRETCE